MPLGIQFDPNMASNEGGFSYQPRDHGPHGDRRRRQLGEPIASRTGRWRSLPPGELDVLLSIAGPTLARLGYC